MLPEASLLIDTQNESEVTRTFTIVAYNRMANMIAATILNLAGAVRTDGTGHIVALQLVAVRTGAQIVR